MTYLDVSFFSKDGDYSDELYNAMSLEKVKALREQLARYKLDYAQEMSKNLKAVIDSQAESSSTDMENPTPKKAKKLHSANFETDFKTDESDYADSVMDVSYFKDNLIEGDTKIEAYQN